MRKLLKERAQANGDSYFAAPRAPGAYFAAHACNAARTVGKLIASRTRVNPTSQCGKGVRVSAQLFERTALAKICCS